LPYTFLAVVPTTRITPIEKKWNMLANWDIFANCICSAAKDNNGLLLDLEENTDKLIIACTGWVPPGTILYSRECAPRAVNASKLYLCDMLNRWYYGGS
jgi:hypothetical protein